VLACIVAAPDARSNAARCVRTALDGAGSVLLVCLVIAHTP
jgi:hypothetical protein